MDKNLLIRESYGVGYTDYRAVITGINVSVEDFKKHILNEFPDTVFVESKSKKGD